MKTSGFSRRIGAAMLAIATTAALWTGCVAPSADAADTPTGKPAPYVEATVLDHTDGTGFNTPAAPWLTRENGFAVGDEGPHDGVVTSGDMVTYRIRLDFRAAKNRTVTVRFKDSTYLAASSASCPSGQHVQGQAWGNSCEYTIPEGVAESVTVDLALLALDTGGTVKTGQRPILSMTRLGGATEELRLGNLTVVSTPNADLVVDNGAMTGAERYPSSCDGRDLSGSFDLTPVALKRKGYSTTHGSSTAFPWQAVVDVSAWPADTVWTLNDTTLTPVGGMLHLPQVTGGVSLKFTLPAKGMTTGDTYVYDIHVIPQSGFTQGQPGDRAERDVDTYDSDLGSGSGRPYANNDWSRAKMTVQPDCGTIPVSYGDLLSISQPYDKTQTVWDDGNTKPPYRKTVLFDSTNDVRMNVGVNTSLRASVAMQPMKFNDDTEWWSFADGLDVTSLPTVVDADGNTVAPGADTYEVYYGTKALNGGGRPDFDDGSLTSTPPSDLSRIRVIGIRRHDPAFSGTATWNLAATGDGAQIVRGEGAIGKGGGGGALVQGGTVFIRKPGLWSYEGGGLSTPANDVKAFDTAEGSYGLIMSDLPSVNLTATVDLTFCLGDGFAHGSLGGSDGAYTITPTTKTGCAAAWHVTGSAKPTGNTIPSSGMGSLPDLDWHGMVRPGAPARIPVSVTGTASTAALGDIPAQTVNIAASGWVSTEMPDTASSTAVPQATLLDPGSPAKTTWTVYAKGEKAQGTVSAMLALPAGGDSVLTGTNNTGLDGSWSEYDRGSSTLPVKLTAQPAVDADATAGTVALSCTTQKVTTLDPNDYTWADITDPSACTAVKADITPDQEGGVAATRITLTANAATASTPEPTGQTNYWPGAPYLGKTAQSTISWPAKAEYAWAVLSGRLYHDANSDGYDNDNEAEDRTHQATITATPVNPDGTTDTTRKTQTWYYLPSNSTWRLSVSSGRWRIDANIDPSKPNDPDKGLLGYGTTHYGLRDNLRTTTATSVVRDVDPGVSSDGIDFGWTNDEPRAKVTQDERRDCTGKTCTLTVDTTITNAGGSTLPREGTTIYSTGSTGDSDDTLSWSDLAFTSGNKSWYDGLLDTTGRLWQVNTSTTQHIADDYMPTVDRAPDYTGTLQFKRVVKGWDGTDWGIDRDNRLLIWPGGCPSASCRAGYEVPVNSADGNHVIGYKWENLLPVKALDHGMGVVDLPSEVGTPTDLMQTGMEFQDMLIESTTGVWRESEGKYTRFTLPGGVTFHLSSIRWSSNQVWGYIIGSDRRVYQLDMSTGKVSLAELPDGGPKAFRDFYRSSSLGYYWALDDEGTLWMLDCSPHTDTSNGDIWHRITLEGGQKVKTLPRGEGYYLPESLHASSLLYIGDDGGMYRLDVSYGYYSLSGEGSDQTTPAGQTRVYRLAEGHTFQALKGNYQPAGRMLAIDTDGRLWGVGRRGVYDITPTDHSALAERHSSHIGTTGETVNTDGTTTRDYALPYDLAPGDSITLTRVFTVKQTDTEQRHAVQTWVDGAQTPYAGTPAQREAKRMTPIAPDASNAPYTPGALTGNDSCLADDDTGDAGDNCSQTAARIPAAVSGLIGGLAWKETLPVDGEYTDTDTTIPGLTVRLLKDGKTVATTTTGQDGTYRFDGLEAGDYTVEFSRPDGLTWVTPDKKDSYPYKDASTVRDSDVDGNGRVAVTIDLDGATQYKQIDAGAYEGLPSLPLTGRPGLWCLLAALLTALAVGWATTRERPGRHRA